MRSGEALDLEARRRVFAAVAAEPGIHFRALLKTVGGAHGALQHHLQRLAEAGLVSAAPDVGFTRYYPVATLSAPDRPALAALRRAYSRRILAVLLSQGPQSTTAVARLLGRSPSTVSWHLGRLGEAGLVSAERQGREVRYAVTEPERVRRLYVQHRSGLMDRLVDQMLGVWESQEPERQPEAGEPEPRDGLDGPGGPG